MRRVVCLEGQARVVVGARLLGGDPVAKRHPEPAPLVRRLDVLEKPKALLEQLLCLLRSAESGRRERSDTIGRGLLVAVAEFTRVLEAQLRLGVRLVVTIQQVEALRATAAKLGDDVTAGGDSGGSGKSAFELH